MTKAEKCIISLVTPLLLSTVGATFTIDAIPTWYAYINKPFFSPPNWLFGPVWTVLYILMGIACYLVWQQAASEKRTMALRWYTIQLILNVLWTPVFFGLRSPVVGFTIIIFLLISILFTTKQFFRLNKISGWLMIPYLAWVMFASVLNAAIVVLN